MTPDNYAPNPIFSLLAGNAVSASTMLQSPPILAAAQDVLRNQTVANFMEGGVLPPAPTRGGFNR